jgi:hypothetical protein
MSKRPQVLLKNNTRASAALVILCLLPVIVGLLIAVFTTGQPTSIIAIFGWLMMLGGLGLTIRQIWWHILPRLACSEDELLVYLSGLRPSRLPLPVVECFFLGQAPSMIAHPKGDEVESSAVVVRLAERATQWHRRDVPVSMGRWCDGYITVRGTWCEPLNQAVVSRMNSSLAAAKRAHKAAQK